MLDNTLLKPRPTVPLPGPSRSAPAAPPVARSDLYVVVHKALRACMAETLVRIGRIDAADPTDRDEALVALEELLGFITDHLQHEDDFIHPAIEARRKAGSARVHDEHVEHLAEIAMLRQKAIALRRSGPDEGAARALGLYRHLARFVADTLLHLDYEESTLNEQLWQLFSDDELDELHQRLRASIPPAGVQLALGWAIPAISPAERAELVEAMKAAMPPEALHGFLSTIAPKLDAVGWTKLERAAGLDSGGHGPVRVGGPS